MKLKINLPLALAPSFPDLSSGCFSACLRLGPRRQATRARVSALARVGPTRRKRGGGEVLYDNVKLNYSRWSAPAMVHLARAPPRPCIMHTVFCDVWIRLHLQFVTSLRILRACHVDLRRDTRGGGVEGGRGAGGCASRYEFRTAKPRRLTNRDTNIGRSLAGRMKIPLPLSPRAHVAQARSIAVLPRARHSRLPMNRDEREHARPRGPRGCCSRAISQWGGLHSCMFDLKRGTRRERCLDDPPK